MKCFSHNNEFTVLVVYANCMMDNLIPVGASSLIGSLREAGFNVRLFDTTFYKTEEQPPDWDRVQNLQVASFDYSSVDISIKDEDVFEDFRRHVLNYKPDVIMLSTVEVTYSQGVKLLESIRDIKPFVMVGGVYAILSPEDLIENSLIDAVCVTEGEDAAAEFCQKFASGETFNDVAGIWFKSEGKIIRNTVDRLVDLNKAAYLDFSLYERNRFHKPMQGRIFKMIPLEFSRGCLFRCSYCVNHALVRHFKPAGHWYRWKSMDRIFSEIEKYLSEYDIEFFYFVSESFLAMSTKKFDQFCERYSDYRIPFWFNTRPETLTKEIVRKLEDINCFRMGIGLEHGNEEFRQKMLNRKVSNKRIVQGCKLVEESNISYSINNMIGFPGETRELVFDTIMLNREINPDTVGTFIFTPFKGTDLYKYCLENGYITSDTKAGDLNRESVLQNNTLSKDEINGLLRTFPLYIHFGEEMFTKIQKAEEFTEKGNKIFHKLAGRYIEEHFGEKCVTKESQVNQK